MEGGVSNCLTLVFMIPLSAGVLRWSENKISASPLGGGVGVGAGDLVLLLFLVFVVFCRKLKGNFAVLISIFY